MRSVKLIVLELVIMMVAVGCQTSKVNESIEEAQISSEVLLLREGDVLKITFPGAPNLDTTQQIRRDGKITLQLVGEVQAAGVTPSNLEKDVIKLYSSQLVSKEVSITVQSASFPVFVTGSVLRPGKVIVDHPMTALEAIMEAGGFNYGWADLDTVTVIRHEEGRVKRFTLNMKLVMDGKLSQPFYLRPSDIIYVPEKLF